MSGFILKDRVRSLDFQKEFGLELLLFCIERCRDQTSPLDASWMLLSEGIPDTSGLKETLRQTLKTL